MNLLKWISPNTKLPLSYIEGGMANDSEFFREISPGIIDLRWPLELPAEDAVSMSFYDGRADDYEKYLHLTFETYGENELTVRESMIDLLELRDDAKVLEVASGTGRDSILISRRLGKGSELWLTDISHEMLARCQHKMRATKSKAKTGYALANATHIPAPDKYFDAVYSFGALGEFSDKKKFFSEIVRVCKPGAKVVVGDENLPVWQRNSTFGKILSNYNKQFLAKIPFSSLPVEARNVKCQWVIGGVFYLIDFVVGVGEPYANFDFMIPGIRGGTHKTRYYGQLEGVTVEAKELAWRAAQKSGVSMHCWLTDLVTNAAKQVLKDGDALD